MDDRLEATLNLLASDAEEDQDGLEWEPHERLVAVGLAATIRFNGSSRTAKGIAWTP